MNSYQAYLDGGCMHSTKVAYLLLTHQPWARFPAFPKVSKGKIINVAEVNQQPLLEESSQWLEKVDRTHLVLANGQASSTKILWLSKAAQFSPFNPGTKQMDTRYFLEMKFVGCRPGSFVLNATIFSKGYQS